MIIVKMIKIKLELEWLEMIIKLEWEIIFYFLAHFAPKYYLRIFEWYMRMRALTISGGKWLTKYKN